MVYSLVPRTVPTAVVDALRRLFRDERDVEVIVDRRRAERRQSGERRAGGEPTSAEERRRIRSAGGRRVGEQRADLESVQAPVELPAEVGEWADLVRFVER